jgi:hypothetical protein
MFNLNLASGVPGDSGPALVKKAVAPAAVKVAANGLPSGSESIAKPRAITAPGTLHLKTATVARRSLQSAVTLWNSYLNDSGQPNRFRVAPNTGDKMIQEINPATGAVVGEYSVAAFPALAKSLGLLGSLLDTRA